LEGHRPGGAPRVDRQPETESQPDPGRPGQAAKQSASCERATHLEVLLIQSLMVLNGRAKTTRHGLPRRAEPGIGARSGKVTPAVD
jgi:hypothetical protein